MVDCARTSGASGFGIALRAWPSLASQAYFLSVRAAVTQKVTWAEFFFFIFFPLRGLPSYFQLPDLGRFRVLAQFFLSPVNYLLFYLDSSYCRFLVYLVFGRF